MLRGLEGVRWGMCVWQSPESVFLVSSGLWALRRSGTENCAPRAILWECLGTGPGPCRAGSRRAQEAGPQSFCSVSLVPCCASGGKGYPAVAELSLGPIRGEGTGPRETLG